MFGTKTPKRSFSDKLDHGVAYPEKQDFPVFISKLYSSGKYSDLIIKCQEKELKVHRAIVCSQSKPLAAAVDNGFKEAKTGVINLEDDEPEIVEYMIKFLYHGTYLIIAPKKNKPNAATLEEDEIAPTAEEVLAVESLLSNLSPSLPSSPSSIVYTTLNTSTQTAEHGTYLQPPAPMTVRNLFGTLPTPFTSATIDEMSSAFVPTTGTALVSDLFRAVPIPTSPFSSLPRLSNMVLGSGVSVASMPNVYGNRRTRGLAPLWFTRQGEEPSTASAQPVNNTNNTFPNPRTGWIFTEAGREWLEAEKAPPNFNSGLMFETTTKAQAANIENLAEDLIKHAKVYITADKYDLQSLKDHARRRYSASLFTCWNSSWFVQSIEIVFDGTPDISEGDSLRNTILDAASIHAGKLLEREDFFQLCEERGDIATAILQARVRLL
ncbi:hypothetical protein EYC80_008001 [Monilinia laxa]|uniref:BTB domain-containing protein n=1 Tax=Monilinia laxa TaxID=61186 RepID=A0A5N6JT61_MONLA|nr:hypothetical protein EYC80_008001 [Monilinia laxa]